MTLNTTKQYDLFCLFCCCCYSITYLVCMALLRTLTCITRECKKKEETDNLTFKSMEVKCVRVIKDRQLPYRVCFTRWMYFLLKLQENLGNGFECFDALDSLGKSSFILGSELREEHFDSLLPLVKDNAQKIKLYGDDSSQS